MEASGWVYGPLPKPSKASRDALTEKFRAIDHAQAAALVSGATHLLGGTDGRGSQGDGAHTWCR